MACSLPFFVSPPSLPSSEEGPWLMLLFRCLRFFFFLSFLSFFFFFFSCSP